jgi:hypothetical protein
MSEVLDLQVYALLARMHEARDTGCRALREAAAEQARQVVAEARHRARQRVKDAVLEKRRRVREHCRRVHVEIETRRRERLFAELGRRLTDGLGALPAVLGARWARPAERSAWCRSVLDGAARVLKPGQWTLLVAPGLDEAEAAALAATAAALSGQEVGFEERTDLAAGLAVVREGARYDGTLAGLLADRNAVQSALLAEIAALEQESS